MARFGSKRLFRVSILIILGALSVLAAPRTSRAGCHVADRPVLGRSLSWERDQRMILEDNRTPEAPPIFTHPPCPGEVPYHFSPSILTLDIATPDSRRREVAIHSEPLFDVDEIERPTPPGCRLDRPPRRSESHFTIG